MVPTLTLALTALTVAGVRTAALGALGRQLLQRRLLYDAALTKLCEAGLATVQRRAGLQVHPKEMEDIPDLCQMMFLSRICFEKEISECPDIQKVRI
jgi:hypothetical protein